MIWAGVIICDKWNEASLNDKKGELGGAETEKMAKEYFIERVDFRAFEFMTFWF